MSEKHKCHLCGRVGQNGARYLVSINNETHKVHKPCGDQLIAGAPQGVKAKLIPSQELKREWQEQRDAKRVRQFWAEKCPELLSLRDKLGQSSAPASSGAASAGPVCQ